MILLGQRKYTLNSSVDSIKPNFSMNLNISVNCLTDKMGKQNEISCMNKKVGISEYETKHPSEFWTEQMKCYYSLAK